jgi:hypothetical protein
MAEQQTLADDDTGSSDKQDQAQRTYTEAEVNDMMARMKTSLTKKLTRQYEDLGDVEELRQLKQESERRRNEEAKKRGEFDKIIQELAEKKDQEIRKRDEIIRNYTVDMPLVDTAAQLGAVNPQQVKQLLKPYVRLSEQGEVEVLDDKGSVRYSDRGTLLGVKDLVQEFLDSNLHFRAAGPTTSHTKSNIGQRPEKLDPSRLDMKNPQHRAMLKELKSKPH